MDDGSASGERRRVLVTGAAGALGHCITSALLRRGHDAIGFDRNHCRLPGAHLVGDIRDVGALCEAARGCDAIVHVAAVPERHEFAQELVPNNIVGTHNVLEAARLMQVGRIVYSSSVRVVGGLDWETGVIGLDAGFAPGDHYGVTKVTSEVLGEMYARRFGLAVVAARLGWFVRNLEEADMLPTLAVGPRIYLSHRDAEEFFVRAVEVEHRGYAAVFVTSKNADDSAFDLAPARQRFGYVPRDTFPEGSSWSSEEPFPSPEVAPSLLPAREVPP